MPWHDGAREDEVSRIGYYPYRSPGWVSDTRDVVTVYRTSKVDKYWRTGA